MDNVRVARAIPGTRMQVDDVVGLDRHGRPICVFVLTDAEVAALARFPSCVETLPSGHGAPARGHSRTAHPTLRLI